MNAITPTKAGEIIEAVIARGDIAQLNAQERAKYYVKVCESVGLNPMTRPFEYITLNGKLVLYARKDATDQLRSLRNVSVTDLIEHQRDGIVIVTAKVCDGNGRTDAATGAVNIAGLKGEALANALMKAESKAKRRATLSICGLGFLDETAIDDIHAEKTAGIDGPPPPTSVSRIEHKPRVDIDSIPPHVASDGSVTWDDPTDPGPIPEIIDRAKTPPPPAAKDAIDEKAWLNDLGGAFSSCEDMVTFGEKQRDVMQPMKSKISAEAWQMATRLAQETFKRIQGT